MHMYDEKLTAYMMAVSSNIFKVTVDRTSDIRVDIKVYAGITGPVVATEHTFNTIEKPGNKGFNMLVCNWWMDNMDESNSSKDDLKRINVMGPLLIETLSAIM